MSSRSKRGWMVAGCGLALVVSCVSRPLVSPIAARQLPPLSGEHRRGEVRALGTGKILVASRELTDPNFAETVVLLVEFTSNGVVGLIVNRQTAVPVSRVFTGPEGLRAGRAFLFLGGPVEVKGILGLARGNGRVAVRHVVGDVYLVNSRESLEALLADGSAPNRLRVYAGYAGWGAEQLQRETIAGAWSVLDGEARIVFDGDPDTLWQRLIKRTGGLLARAATERTHRTQGTQ